jgi:glycosyltransferase involved in cell wall biosynthesis
MNVPIFSVIIPVYKVAEYLTRCLDSLLQQDIPYTAYEIICVNDGSPDNCREIIENFQKKYSNIVLLNQENQGVSMARNNGIAIAKGTYILPIDADDYVVPNSLGKILNSVEKLDCEVVYLGFEIFDADEKSIWKTDYSKQNHHVFSGVEGYFQARGYDVKDPDRSWAILYKKELLDKFGITYPQDVPILEDGLFLGKVFSVAKSVMFIDEIFYLRTTRLDSAINSTPIYSERVIDGFIKAIVDIRNFKNQYLLSQTQNGLVNHIVAKYVLLAIAPSISRLEYKGYSKVLRKLKQAKIFKVETQGLRFRYKKHMKMFNLSQYFFPIYFKFFNK